MSEDRFNELLRQCKDSPIERKLLRDLYPHLTVDRARELQAQHRIDYFHDMDVTIPDFAFPDIRIAIYCDGYQWHKDYEPFCKDRYQSRELQLRSWIVLRFTGNEINDESEMVLETVQRADHSQEEALEMAKSTTTGTPNKAGETVTTEARRGDVRCYCPCLCDCGNPCSITEFYFLK